MKDIRRRRRNTRSDPVIATKKRIKMEVLSVDGSPTRIPKKGASSSQNPDDDDKILQPYARIKDKNAPRRPRNAYVYFLSEQRLRYEKEHNTKKYADINRGLAAKWSAMSPQDKEPYNAKASADRKKYEEQLAEYHQTNEFKEFQEKKVILMKKRAVQLGQKSTSKSDLEHELKDEENDKDVVPMIDGVSIFTDEFLELNKKQELKLKKLRQESSILIDEKRLLTNRIKSLEEEIEKLKERQRKDAENAQKVLDTKALWSRTLLETFKGVRHIGDRGQELDTYISFGNADDYMDALTEMIEKNPKDPALNIIRTVLSHADFLPKDFEKNEPSSSRKSAPDKLEQFRKRGTTKAGRGRGRKRTV